MANHYQQKEKTKMPQIPNVNLKEYVKAMSSPQLNCVVFLAKLIKS